VTRPSAPRATTPEELETLLEDACIVQDMDAVRRLLDRDAVLDRRALLAARGEEAGTPTALWARERRLLATPRLVLQAGDTALSVGAVINVMRRGPDRAWRYAICSVPNNERST
jgi:hypothetical protein